MAVADVSPEDKDTIKATLEPLDDVQRVDAPGAHGPNDTNGWRILKPGHSGKIRSGISAPVTQKSQDFRLKRLAHSESPPSLTPRSPCVNCGKNLPSPEVHHVNGLLRAGSRADATAFARCRNGLSSEALANDLVDPDGSKGT